MEWFLQRSRKIPNPHEICGFDSGHYNELWAGREENK